VRVFVQGATGVLGRRLVRDFSAAGHEVVGLARNARGEAAVRAAGGTPAKADVFDAASLASAAAGANTVVRAATHIPAKARVGPRDFAENARLRTEGTKALLAAAVRVGASTYLQEGIVWVASPPDGSAFDEDAPPQANAVTESMIEAEELAGMLAAEGKITATTLRLGNLYAPEAWHTRAFAERLRARRLPVVGDGEAPFAVLHADDASAAFVAAAASPRSGIYHVMDDAAVPIGDLLREFARLLGAPAPGRVPKWLARLAAGRFTADFLTTPMRTTNARFKQAFRWQPRYPTYRETLASIVAQWQAEGGPPPPQ
jgi:nucleoside-diphosphate-sugar epimerase